MIKWLARVLLIFTFILFIPLLIGLVAGITIVEKYSKELPDVKLLATWRPQESSRIYSQDGKLLATLYVEDRIWVPLEQISPYMKKAIVAIEDSDFYIHPGINPKSIIRAAFANFTAKEITQGGSTITQQLARNLFLTPEVSFERKIKEILLALEIEKHFSKDEILEFYLNQIPFGAGTFGVEAASELYFGKKASELNLAESALLAGIPQAPSIYSPFVDTKSAKNRQIAVLRRMETLGLITSKEAEIAIQTPLVYQKNKMEGFQGYLYPYFTLYCIKEASELVGKDELFKGGLIVYSTLDTHFEEEAISALQWGIAKGERENANCKEGALICVEPNTGFIKAMVGGREFNVNNQFNRAWQALRQPGSAFKVFVYTAALENGYLPSAIFTDTPVSYEGVEKGERWAPCNSDHKFMGAMDLYKALYLSRNVIAVKLIEKVGVDKIIELAHRLGIKEELSPNLSLALGTSSVSVMSMASALATIANGGKRLPITTIAKIETMDGRIVIDNSNPKGEQVITPQLAYIITKMLQKVIDYGTGYNARLVGRPAAGKTGTTSDFRDAWFVGFTPQYVTCVWMGNDDYTPMNRVYGGDFPSMIWQKFMSSIHRGLPVKNFSEPPQLNKVEYCSITGLAATHTCPKGGTEFAPPGVELIYCSGNHPASTSAQDKIKVIETPSQPPSYFTEEVKVDGVILPGGEDTPEEGKNE